jgi:hypothetical protein
VRRATIIVFVLFMLLWYAGSAAISHGRTCRTMPCGNCDIRYNSCFGLFRDLR